MQQSTPLDPMMTGRNPTGQYRPVGCSSTWQWVVRPERIEPPSREAKVRLAWLEWHETHGRNVSLTCRRHGISRPTFYRWRKRCNASAGALENRSCVPRRTRRRQWTDGHVQAVLALREQYPGRGKMKIQIHLKRVGITMSASMIGRILKECRRDGRLREPTLVVRQHRRRWRERPWARRSTAQERMALWPGDLLQLDTKDIRPAPNKLFKQLTLVDVVTRIAAAEVGYGLKSKTMATYLDAMISRLPFTVCGIQVDGGSEFRADFERYCQSRQLPLYVLPPRSPKLNGRVERLQRTFQEEFYDCYPGDLTVEALRPALRRFEADYNLDRPHQSLGYLTPSQYLDSRKAAACKV